MAKFSDDKSGSYCTCTRERCSDECRTYRQFRPKPITNADRIRGMNDEELAHFLEMKAGRFVSFYPTPAKNWLDWLRQEAKDAEPK